MALSTGWRAWVASWLWLWVWASAPAVVLAAEPVALRLLQTPHTELVIARVDSAGCLLSADMLSADNSARPVALQAVTLPDEQPVRAQFVPDPASVLAPTAEAGSVGGLVLLQFPAGTTPTSVRLTQDNGSGAAEAAFDGTVARAGFVAEHRAGVMGGLPCRFQFPVSGKEFAEFSWNDRVYHSQLGGFMLRHDQQARVELISSGPICSVVRAQAAYKQADGTQPPSRPRAVYHWHYFHEWPLVFVTAAVVQDDPADWNEVHFLELIYPGRDFDHYVGDDLATEGVLSGDNSSHRFQNWAGIVDQGHGIGMFGCGRVLVYDGRGGYGTYLHADGDRAWHPWHDRQRTYSAWLWLGTDKQPGSAIRSWQERFPGTVTAVLSPEPVHRAIAAARASLRDGAETADAARHVAWAARLEMAGRFDAALAVLQGHLPDDWKYLSAGDLQLAVQQTEGGVRLQSLFDIRSGHEHAPAVPAPLFRITLHNADSGQQRMVVADRGWDQVSLEATGDRQLEMRWQQSAEADTGALTVVVRAVADPAEHAIRWTLEAAGQQAPWSLSHVAFPQLRLVAPGDTPVLLFPRGPGELQRNAWREAFTFGGLYPNGWNAMQFMAAYDQAAGRGLYWALHDPLGSAKDLSANSDPQAGTVMLVADHPVPELQQPGNRFALSGVGIWQAFSGDWFDAAQIYRRWVRAEARWFPTLSTSGRDDTPLWMRELCVWAQTGGEAQRCVEPVIAFAKYLGVPAGFHWYNWHLNPFDNDYPHYFPTTPGFTAGVARLQESQVYVMPYINGRLWDTRDRGLEDFEFTQRALPATAKKDTGEPFTEVYGSKEQDGSSVRLAVMCPTTALWQDQVRAILARLFTEHRVAGVYIDQIAAAPPALCMDPHHGHPRGGGAWWNEGYWQMLDKIRQEMPAGCMLTTECNAEPFLRWFDGSPTWHWQYDGQVPAFPAIYGGAIQMFGRAYRGGPTQDLALRMKAGQQLVYGEQIGWLDPRVIEQADSGSFLRQIVQLRWQLRRYFYAGEMCRPPQLDRELPTVRADWQWHGSWWVTTDAVLTGTWQQPHAQRAVAMFVNVSDEPLEAVWSCDATTFAFDTPRVVVTAVTAEGPGEQTQESNQFRKTLIFPPRSAMAWEITPVADR